MPKTKVTKKRTVSRSASSLAKSQAKKVTRKSVANKSVRKKSKTTKSLFSKKLLVSYTVAMFTLVVASAIFSFNAITSGNFASNSEKVNAQAGATPPLSVSCNNTISSGSISTSLNSLSAGQTLCLTGTFNQSVSISKSGVTLASTPGQTARINGQLKINRGANNVRIIGLFLDGRGIIISPHVLGNGAVFQGNSVTNTSSNRGICFAIGETDTGDEVQGITIDGNRIFKCGARVHDQGIYLEYVRNAVVTNNYIYDGPDFGIQFYPSAQNSRFEYNVVDGNYRGVTFSGKGTRNSNNNIVRYNIITNNTTGGANIESYWEAGAARGTGNIAENNCLQGSRNINASNGGFTERNNIVADPGYVNRGAKDFRLRAGSPCAAMGPRSSTSPLPPTTPPQTPLPPSPSPNPTPAPPPSTQPTNQVTPEVIISGVNTPWSMQFAPDGKLYFTERKGTIRVYENGQLRAAPVATVPTDTGDEEGLQGLALHPNFASNGWLYVYYTYNSASGLKNRLVRYTINQQAATVASGPTTLIDAIPGYKFHNGGRIKFGPDGKLYVATGAAIPDTIAQDKNSLGGKILRVNDDGSAAAGNPFGNRVYSWGHRNPQGLAWHPTTGELWSTEHGPSSSSTLSNGAKFCCNDEINKIVSGGNYGWPKYFNRLTNPSYGSITVDNPVYPVWSSGSDTKWAPGGATFYSGTKLSSPWTNSLLFTGLGFEGSARALYRLKLSADGKTPTGVDTLYKNQYGRLRDVIQGPDGALYIATSNRDGRGSPIAADDRIIRLKPTGSVTTTPTPPPNPTPDPAPSTPSDPTPVPTTGTLTEAEDAFSCFVKGITTSSCEQARWSWSKSGATNKRFVALTHSGDSILHKFDITEAGNYRLMAVLKSESYRGSAKVDVYMDGIRIRAGYPINQTTLTPYYVDRQLSAGQHSVKIVFTNDKCGNLIPRESCTSSTDRNLWIDYFKISKL